MTTSDDTPRWIVVHTASRCEKKVRERLEAKNITCFLPIQTILRQWKYRKKKVQVPVISGMIFVKTTPANYLDILHTQGVVSFLKLRGENHPAIIPDKQMETFRFLVDSSEDTIEIINENLAVGDLITVIKGPLKGLEGELVSFKGYNKIMIRIESLGCALVDAPSTYVKTLAPR